MPFHDIADGTRHECLPDLIRTRIHCDLAHQMLRAYAPLQRTLGTRGVSVRARIVLGKDQIIDRPLFNQTKTSLVNG